MNEATARETDTRCDAIKEQGGTVSVRHEFGVYWAKVRTPRRSVYHAAGTFDRALLGALERWEGVQS